MRKKTMREMPANEVTGLVNQCFITDSSANTMVGAVVKFIVTEENKTRLGLYAQVHKYEIVGTQRCWGWDGGASGVGNYTMIDGYRLICLGYEDRFGRPAAPYEIQVLTTLN
jgi:hypothetical protein